MTEEVSPKTETVEAPPAAKPQDVWEDGTPFDPERAKATIQTLRAFEKEAKPKLAEYERLKAEADKRAEAEMTEADKLKKQATDAAAENAKLKADLLKRDVVAETGLPAVFADRLQGATKEEMLEDARKILAVLPKQKVNPTLNATNPSNGQEVETDAQLRARLFGPQGNPFDINTIKAQGGGVKFKE